MHCHLAARRWPGWPEIHTPTKPIQFLGCQSLDSILPQLRGKLSVLPRYVQVGGPSKSVSFPGGVFDGQIDEEIHVHENSFEPTTCRSKAGEVFLQREMTAPHMSRTKNCPRRRGDGSSTAKDRPGIFYYNKALASCHSGTVGRESKFGYRVPTRSKEWDRTVGIVERLFCFPLNTDR